MLGSATSLTWLYASPGGLHRLTRRLIRRLRDLTGNSMLYGAVPAELGSLTALVHLCVAAPTLGPFTECPDSRRSKLTQNALSGSIPASLSALSSLESLCVLASDCPSILLKQQACRNVEFNTLSGPLPAALGSLHRLTYLCDQLGGDGWGGVVSLSVLSRCRLTQLVLVRSVADNRFAGSLPATWGSLASLTALCVAVRHSAVCPMTTHVPPPGT